MGIIVDSIKDDLIPQVSSKKTPKEMYDTLSIMYEGRNINRKMNLRAQLKSIKMSHGESIQDYFTRVSQIKEQLEAIGDGYDCSQWSHYTLGIIHSNDVCQEGKHEV